MYEGTSEQLDAVIVGIRIVQAHLNGEEPELTHGWVKVDDPYFFGSEPAGTMAVYQHRDDYVFGATDAARSALGLGFVPIELKSHRVPLLYVKKKAV